MYLRHVRATEENVVHNREAPPDKGNPVVRRVYAKPRVSGREEIAGLPKAVELEALLHRQLIRAIPY